MEQPAQVQLTVIGLDGSLVLPRHGARRRQRQSDDSRTTARHIRGSAGPRAGEGPAIRDASESTLDTDIRELTVPDLAAPEVGLSTPGVFRARTAPEAQTILNDANAVPVVAREFRRTERIIVRAQAYGPGTEVPAVTAKLLNRVGTAMQDLPVTLDQADRCRAAGPAAVRHRAGRGPARSARRRAGRRSQATGSLQSRVVAAASDRQTEASCVRWSR